MASPNDQGSSLTSAISSAVGRVVADDIGRGSTSVRTTIRDEVVVCVMRDTFTKAEHSLISAGQGDDVKDMRQRFQRTVQEDLVGAVSDLTGRRVEAFFSDHNVDPDIAVEIFLLAEPLDAPA